MMTSLGKAASTGLTRLGRPDFPFGLDLEAPSAVGFTDGASVREDNVISQRTLESLNISN